MRLGGELPSRAEDLRGDHVKKRSIVDMSETAIDNYCSSMGGRVAVLSATGLINQRCRCVCVCVCLTSGRRILEMATGRITDDSPNPPAIHASRLGEHDRAIARAW